MTVRKMMLHYMKMINIERMRTLLCDDDDDDAVYAGFHLIAGAAPQSKTAQPQLSETQCSQVPRLTWDMYQTKPYHTIPYSDITYHTISYHAISYHTIVYHSIPRIGEPD